MIHKTTNMATEWNREEKKIPGRPRTFEEADSMKNALPDEEGFKSELETDPAAVVGTCKAAVDSLTNIDFAWDTKLK